jgi:hypothetical protein
MRSRIRSGRESSGIPVVVAVRVSPRLFSLPPCGGGSGWGVATSTVLQAPRFKLSAWRPPPPTPPRKGEGSRKITPRFVSIPQFAFAQFVFATCGGMGVVMNWVASSIAVPSGVGTVIRNGTRMRVPANGANAISMLRWATRYLITGRSGM